MGDDFDVGDDPADRGADAVQQRPGEDPEEHDEYHERCKHEALPPAEVADRDALVNLGLSVEGLLVGPEQVDRSEDDTARRDDRPPTVGEECAGQDEELSDKSVSPGTPIEASMTRVKTPASTGTRRCRPRMSRTENVPSLDRAGR